MVGCRGIEPRTRGLGIHSSIMNNRVKKRLYNVDEAAEYLGRSVWSIRELMYKGTLPYVKVGKRVSFDIHDLDKFIEMHKMTFTY
jgi:excisionase family DNA binding protein